MSAKLDILKWTQPPGQAKELINLSELLQELDLLESKEDLKRLEDPSDDFNRKWGSATPESLQLIRSGVTTLSKRWMQIVGSAGGIAGLATTVTGIVQAIISDVGTPVTVALIAGGAAILAASAIALALFVSGDLNARGNAAAAQQPARGEVAAAFLRFSSLPPERRTAPADQLGQLIRDLDRVALNGRDLKVVHGKRSMTYHQDS